jgi:hypothetical protein
MADISDARERLFKCRRLLLGSSVALPDIRDGARDAVLRWFVKQKYIRRVREEGGIQELKGMPSRITITNRDPGFGAINNDPNNCNRPVCTV